VDGTGNVYITDSGNQRIRKVSAATGVITTVAGNGIDHGDLGDNGPATSASLSASGVAVDGSGNIYIADGGNSRIRKVSADTGVITTVAGNGNFGYSGDDGPATSASLDEPQGRGRGRQRECLYR
jgi:sugar lactone lactonase YvrE